MEESPAPFEKAEEKGFWATYYENISLKDSLVSLVSRRPSALHALDGLRAIAITWVFMLHLCETWPQFMLCFPDSMTEAPTKFLITGELGVDIFFALSGFLIAFILVKECQKYDKPIDLLNFYRGRFLRVWPSMALLSLILVGSRLRMVEGEYGRPTVGNILAPLFFSSNLTGQLQIQWSVSVEYQFYLISPFIVWYMYKQNGKNLWVIPVILFVVSTLLNFGINWFVCPDMLRTNNVWLDQCDFMPADPAKECKACTYKWFMSIYFQTPTRMSPYGFGMLAAFEHLEAKKLSAE